MLDDATSRLNDFAAAWGAWCVSSLMSTACVLLIVSTIWVVIRRRASAQFGHGLFLLVVLKLFVPMHVSVPHRLISWIPGLSASPALHLQTDQETKGVSTSAAATTAFLPASTDATTSLESTRRRIATSSPAHAPESSFVKISWQSWALLCWLVTGAFVLVRSIRSQRRFNQQLIALRQFDSSLSSRVTAICRRIGIRPIPVVVMDDLTSPAVFGLLRPTILMPSAMASALSSVQLEWVLLHEIAHIRRRDLLFSACQRCACLIQPWNPSLWIANRAANRLREYACDDVAVAHSSGTCDDFGSAFLQVLRFASNSKRLTTTGALGLFESDGKASCEVRMLRLLDSHRRLSPRLGFGAIAVLILMAVLTLPQLSIGKETPEPANSPSQSDSSGVADENLPQAESAQATFTLLVVGPDEKPVPGAEVELGTDRMPQVQVLAGQRGAVRDHRMLIKADDAGSVVIAAGDQPLRFLSVKIEIPGFGPYLAVWDTPNEPVVVPRSHIARLDAGISIGGIVVDSTGAAVANVSISPQDIQFKSPQPQWAAAMSINPEQLRTDGQGRWAFHSLPKSVNHVTLNLFHPDYSPTAVTRPVSELAIPTSGEGDPKLEIADGLIVRGKVADANGQPIAQASIRTEFEREWRMREAETDAEGAYALKGMRPGRVALVVVAKGYATDLQSVSLAEPASDVDFRLNPGKTLRLRVTDEEGNPIRSARISIEGWRSLRGGSLLGKGLEYTNPEGYWEWNEVPEDEVIYSVSARDKRTLRNLALKPGDKEQKIVLKPAQKVTGRIVSRQSGQLIKNAVITTGYVRNGRVSWTTSEQTVSSDGTFRLGNRAHVQEVQKLRITASGFHPAISRAIDPDEQNVTLDIELEPGADLSGQVLLPNGKPAAGAKVGFSIQGSYISFKNGHIDGGESRTADAEGRFQIPPQIASCVLLVEHPEGYVSGQIESGEQPGTLPLTPWGRVSGVCRIGGESVANATITLDVANTVGKHWSTPYEAATATDGTFVIDRVLAGEGRIQRPLRMVGRRGIGSTASTPWMPIQIGNGETTRVTLGGSGRPVVGKLITAAGINSEIDWSYCTLSLHLVTPDIPRPPVPPKTEVNSELRAQWMKTWEFTPEGKAWSRLMDSTSQRRLHSTQYYAEVARDGTFRIDDVLPDEFELRAVLEVANSQRTVGNSIGMLKHRFTVPPTNDGRSDEPLDLGTLTLQKVE